MTYMYVYIRQTCMSLSVCMSASMHIYCMHVDIYVCRRHVCIYVCIYVYGQMCMRICMCVCTYICRQPCISQLLICLDASMYVLTLVFGIKTISLRLIETLLKIN